MGRRAGSKSNTFSRTVSATIQALVSESTITTLMLFKATEISSNYYYGRIRGDLSFTTNDIERIAQALGTNGYEVLRRVISEHDSAISKNNLAHFELAASTDNSVINPEHGDGN